VQQNEFELEFEFFKQNSNFIFKNGFNIPTFLSLYLSNTCIVTKRKKLVPTFLYHMKDHSS